MDVSNVTQETTFDLENLKYSDIPYRWIRIRFIRTMDQNDFKDLKIICEASTVEDPHTWDELSNDLYFGCADPGMNGHTCEMILRKAFPYCKF